MFKVGRGSSNAQHSGTKNLESLEVSHISRGASPWEPTLKGL